MRGKAFPGVGAGEAATLPAQRLAELDRGEEALSRGVEPDGSRREEATFAGTYKLGQPTFWHGKHRLARGHRLQRCQAKFLLVWCEGQEATVGVDLLQGGASQRATELDTRA